MADFEKAYNRTLRHEGGIADSPADRGKLTWKGIAHNYHPDWSGWVIVQSYISKYPNWKTNPQSKKMLNKSLFADAELDKMVGDFYKKGFWDFIKLGDISSQWLADNVFDASVNCGVRMGPIFLQRAINRLYPANLVTDGILGNKSFAALNKVLEQLGEDKLVNTFIDIRKEYHYKIVANNPSQKVFIKNWISRCENMRKKVD